MSHHVICHVIAVSYASLLSQKKIKKENKINIKSEKLNKRNKKLLVFKAFYNKTQLYPVLIEGDGDLVTGRTRQYQMLVYSFEDF